MTHSGKCIGATTLYLRNDKEVRYPRGVHLQVDAAAAASGKMGLLREQWRAGGEAEVCTANGAVKYHHLGSADYGVPLVH
jgi:hypothetical protein